MDVGLVNCTKSKRESAAPPREPHEPSAYFRKARAYCERTHDELYILSANHHLLNPDCPPIAPYDETLTTAGVQQLREWIRTVRDQLERKGLLEDERTLVVHVGKDYYTELLPLLPDDIEVAIPTEGLTFGDTVILSIKKQYP